MNGELIFQRGNRLTVWGSDQERLGRIDIQGFPDRRSADS
jgi:hypothetical protein